MTFLLTKLFGAASVPVLLFSIFYAFDQFASESAKSDISSWLMRLSVPNKPTALSPILFHNLFNSVFGVKFFSFRCIILSFSFSLSIILFTGAIWTTLHTEDALTLWAHVTDPSGLFNITIIPFSIVFLI
jgi:hypothetical protein